MARLLSIARIAGQCALAAPPMLVPAAAPRALAASSSVALRRWNATHVDNVLVQRNLRDVTGEAGAREAAERAARKGDASAPRGGEVTLDALNASMPKIIIRKKTVVTREMQKRVKRQKKKALEQVRRKKLMETILESKRNLPGIKWPQIETDSLESDLSAEVVTNDPEACGMNVSEEMEVLNEEIVVLAKENHYFEPSYLGKAIEYAKTRHDMDLMAPILIAARNCIIPVNRESATKIITQCLRAGSPLSALRLLPHRDRCRLPVTKSVFQRLLYRLYFDLQRASRTAASLQSSSSSSSSPISPSVSLSAGYTEGKTKFFIAYVTEGAFTCVRTQAGSAIIDGKPVTDGTSQLAALDTVFKLFYLMCMDYRHAPDYVTYSLLINSALAVHENPMGESQEATMRVKKQAWDLAKMAMDEARQSLKINITPKTMTRFAKAQALLDSSA